MYHSKFPNPDYVFLLGDNIYGDDVVSPATNTQFNKYVAKGSTCPHYVILGNYDLATNVRERVHYEMAKEDPRWIFPSSYYFEKFTSEPKGEFSLCTWFTNTDRFTKTQGDWLREGIRRERDQCTWTMVVGHRPGHIQASGKGDRHIGRYLEPILSQEKVDIYLAAHHHNLQHLRYETDHHPLNVFITGRTSLNNHGMPRRTAEKGEILWGDVAEPAILVLNVTRERITAEYHSGYRSVDSDPIYSAIINH